MNLYTRCPQCATVFRVSTAQLQASNGQVRCGQCQTVFDGFATLSSQESDMAIDGPNAGVPAVIAQGTSQSAREKLPLESQPGLPAKPEILARPDPAASLYEWEFRVASPPKRNGLWLVLSLFMLLALGAQAAFAFRQELMILSPDSNRLYQRVCEILDCQPELPAIAGVLHIESSDLRVADPQQPSEIELLLAIRNRAAVAVAFPAIELTLTDSREQTVARRIFLPVEYLGKSTAATAFEAGRELPIQLFLETGGLRAAGYRLYLFYP
jgi:predicted Zn finger-like uncharacterized protein